MSCERFLNCCLKCSQKLPKGHPDQILLADFINKKAPDCPSEQRSHASKLAGIPPKKSELAVVGEYITEHGEVVDVLEEHDELGDMVA